MPTFLRDATRTARKVHHCGMCGAMITIGSKHHVSTNLYDGRVYDFRTCEACEKDRITGTVYDWAGMPDEGVELESASEWAHDYADAASPDERHAALRWLRRNGCGCERCEARVFPPAETPDGAA